MMSPRMWSLLILILPLLMVALSLGAVLSQTFGLADEDGFLGARRKELLRRCFR